MNDGSYFFIQDTNYLTRQSHGVFLVHNLKISPVKIFFYCYEYDQYWSRIEKLHLDNPTEFKKTEIIPICFSEVINLDCNLMISGVADFKNQRIQSVIKF